MSSRKKCSSSPSYCCCSVGRCVFDCCFLRLPDACAFNFFPDVLRASSAAQRRMRRIFPTIAFLCAPFFIYTNKPPCAVVSLERKKSIGFFFLFIRIFDLHALANVRQLKAFSIDLTFMSSSSSC